VAQVEVDRARAQIRTGADPLGDAFCTYRGPADRRQAGAFYTPAPLVRAMVEWTLGHGPARVVDAGCGSGRFAVELRRAGFDGELVAVDFDPLATLMTRAHLAAAGFDREQVLCADFLTLQLPPCRGATAFIGNPPYVRHHTIARRTKTWARRAGKRAGVALSGLSGLHALFMLGAHLSSRDGDFGCFVTSGEWLDARYGAAIRELLSGPMGLRFLDLLDPRVSAFEDAMSTAVVVGWEKGYTGPANVRGSRTTADLDPVGSGRHVHRARLASTDKWGSLPRPAAPLAERRIPLADLVRVHRGVATGSNAFFAVPFEAGARLGLTPHLRPCLNRARQVIRSGGTVLAADCTHGLLDLGRSLPDDPALTRYLEYGERLDVPRRYLCRHRQPWWRVGGTDAPPIVVTYMARQPPSFALNPDRCQILNVLHGIHFIEEVEPAFQAALAAWLQAHRDELRGYRTYHGGLQKWEPRDLEGVLVPPPGDLL